MKTRDWSEASDERGAVVGNEETMSWRLVIHLVGQTLPLVGTEIAGTRAQMTAQIDEIGSEVAYGTKGVVMLQEAGEPECKVIVPAASIRYVEVQRRHA